MHVGIKAKGGDAFEGDWSGESGDFEEAEGVECEARGEGFLAAAGDVAIGLPGNGWGAGAADALICTLAGSFDLSGDACHWV